MDSREDTLKELLKIEQENNRMLRNLRSSMRWNHFFTVIKWVIVIGVIVGGFYYIEPYVAKVIDVVTAGKADGNAISQSWNTFLSDLGHGL
jgi:hypothetical protein